MAGSRTLSETQQAISDRIGAVSLDFEAMEVVSHLYRATSAVRNHLENSVLRPLELSWTGFVVLWVVWVAEEMETRRVAAEAGITKGTLTGVVKTLEARGLIQRHGHPADGRLVLLRLTERGSELMEKLFPAFNREESVIVSPLEENDRRTLARGLRDITARLEERRTLAKSEK